jgi:hypothetical protein
MFPFCLVVVVDALRSGRALSKRAGTTPSDALHINVQINDNISPKIRPPKKIGPNDKIVRTVRMLALATVATVCWPGVQVTTKAICAQCAQSAVRFKQNYLEIFARK